MNRNLSKDEINFILSELSEGKSKLEISQTANRSLSSIYVTERRAKEGPKKRKSRRIARFNDDYFESVDSNEKAYWLGFWFADGCVSKDKRGGHLCSLCLAEQDRDHVVKFLRCIGFDFNFGRMYQRQNVSSSLTGDKCQDQFLASLLSKKMFDDLTGLGCWERKTLTLEAPKIDPKYKSSFIRGYYDGDGGFSFFERGDAVGFKTNLGISSTPSLLQYIQEGIEKVTGCSGCIRKAQNSEVHCLSYSGNRVCLKIFDYMYGELKEPFLQRKFEKTLKCMERFCQGGANYLKLGDNASKIKTPEIVRILLKFLGEEKLKAYGII